MTDHKSNIQKAVNYINSNLSRKLTLDEIAEQACFSPFHFHRIFSSIVGETPGEYVVRLRLEKSANLLELTNSSVTEIALQCGFTSSSVFARSFKDYFGISATQWRKNSKICKTDSSIRKAYLSLNEYIDNVNHNNIQGDSEMEFKVLRNVPEMHLAFIANLDGYNDKIGSCFERLCYWAGPRNLIGKQTKFLGIAFDNPDITSENKCRYYACMTVPAETETAGEIGNYFLPSSDCISGHYEGGKDGISQAYKQAYLWIAQNGWEPADIPCYEVYDSAKGDPYKGIFVMDIFIPVKPASLY